MMTTKQLEKQIQKLYATFFEDLKIDKRTGIVEGIYKRFNRFSGYPYIGVNYVNAPVRILFIPYDTGEDEKFADNTFHDFESRRKKIPTAFDKNNELVLNPHIAGTYATALYILKDKMHLQDAWDALWSKREYTIKKAIKKSSSNLPPNLMSYVAYENRFRFVTFGRGWELDNFIIGKDGIAIKKNLEEITGKDKIKERGGGKDRIWLKPEREAQLLADEISIFEPEIIVFQGKQGLWNCNIDGLKKKYQVVVANHPSCWQRKADKLQYIEEYIAPQL